MALAQSVLIASMLLALGAAGCSPSRTAAVVATPHPAPVEFVAHWGVPGKAPGQLGDPVGPAMDGASRVYFADRASQFLQKFTVGGVPLLSFQTPAARSASAVAVDAGGAIYVANVHAGEIQVFFPQGPLLRVLRVSPQRNFEGAFGFSADSTGKIYVPDPAGARVQVLSSEGRLLASWKLPSAAGAAPRPVSAMASADGFVYVADAATGSIIKFAAATGEPSAVWQSPSGAAAVLGLAVSGQHILVLHAASPRLRIWSSDGRIEAADDLGGRLNSVDPSRLSIAAGGFGDFLVLDSGVPRVLQFRTHLDAP